MAIAPVTVKGRLGAATRISWGHYYMTCDDDGWTVFDDRNPDGRARLTDALHFDEAVRFAHDSWLDESYGQGRAKPRTALPAFGEEGGGGT